MTEKELVEKLEAAHKVLAEARKNLTRSKKELTDAETQVISAKLEADRVKEELRAHRATIPSLQPEISLRDQEIEQFREDHPDVCAFARERDLNRP